METKPKSPWPWVIIAIACAIGVVLSFGGVFAYTFSTMTTSSIELALDGETRILKSELSEKPTIFLRERSNFTPGDALATISATDAAGNAITVTANSMTTLEIPSGTYESVASLDLTTMPSNAQIRVQTTGVSGVISSGDLMIMPEVLGGLLLAIGSSCIVNVILVGVAITAVIIAIKRFTKT